MNDPKTPLSEQYLSSAQLVKYLGMSYTKILALKNEGMPCYKIGNIYRFKRKEVDEYIKKYKRNIPNARN